MTLVRKICTQNVDEIDTLKKELSASVILSELLRIDNIKSQIQTETDIDTQTYLNIS